MRQIVTTLPGRQEPLLGSEGVVKRRRLAWYGHVSQDTVEGSRRKGRQRKAWLDLSHPATLLRMADGKNTKSSLSAQVSDMAPPKTSRGQG